MDNNIGIILLTYNEDIHIRRCLDNLLLLTSNIYVVDSFSNDKTVAILDEYGINYCQNEFKNHSNQLNFAINTFPFVTNYILRMDCDEILSNELINEIKTSNMLVIDSDISGFYIKRKVIFFNKILNYGNINPIWLLRLWKRGKGFCDDKLMDEKIVVTDQKTAKLQNIILDNNLNNLTWWTNKHNNYSNREALEILKSKYIASSYSFIGNYYSIDYFVCLLKVLYNKMPIFFRSFLLFFYSYFLKLGILDGLPGFIWNILQVFWYRYLVDPGIFRKLRYALWLFTSNIFFLTNIPYPNKLKVLILKLFGGKIGNKVVIKPWVKIKFPWMLILGNAVWLGESVWIDNISEIKIGDNVCISQGALLITGNHNYSSKMFELNSKPIKIEDGVWICAKSIVVGGVTIHSHAVLAINSMASSDLESYSIYSGNPAIFLKNRIIE